MSIKTKKFCRSRGGCRFIGMIFLGIVGAVIFALIFGLVVQFLWNWLAPDLFGLKTITYLQAFALVILAKIFFGGFGRPGRHPHHHPRDRYKFKLRMTGDKGALPEEALDNPEEFERFWNDQGKEAFRKFMETAEKPEGGNKTED